MSQYKFEIIPLESVGPVKLGTSKKETRRILKGTGMSPTTRSENEDSCSDHGFGISYTDGDEDTAQVYAVELTNNLPNNPIKAMFQGKDLFEISYEECRQHLLEFYSFKPTYDEFSELSFSELDMILSKMDHMMKYLHKGHFNILSIGDGDPDYWNLRLGNI
ncbi:hypothetical protein [Deinococcus sp.]|uniref:hypothetical protein n=1 Tax=Deinococcus sp. TaxID=47478 RepID=UPI0025FD4D51|nr:hypothetical protein [Deinococcus sp.]